MLRNSDMSIDQSRALLTEKDRQYIDGGADNSEKYQAVSRVRNRIQNELHTDLVVLQENHEELFQEVVEVFEDV